MKYEELLKKGILEEKEGLLINKSCNHTNYFTILEDMLDISDMYAYINYWPNCVQKYYVKEDAPVAKDAVDLFKDEMKYVIFDSVYFNKALYIVAKTRKQCLQYFNEKHAVTIKFMYWEYDAYFSDCVVYDSFTQMYYIVFKIVNVPEEERLRRLICK